jgi:hypothetical protein
MMFGYLILSPSSSAQLAASEAPTCGPIPAGKSRARLPGVFDPVEGCLTIGFSSNGGAANGAEMAGSDAKKDAAPTRRLAVQAANSRKGCAFTRTA